MQFKLLNFALAAALAMSILYLGCAVYMHFYPSYALKMLADLLHLSTLSWMEPQVYVTPATVISGVIQTFVYTFVYGLLFAGIYNLLSRDN